MSWLFYYASNRCHNCPYTCCGDSCIYRNETTGSGATSYVSSSLGNIPIEPVETETIRKKKRDKQYWKPQFERGFIHRK
jgi:hypothetical protein